MPFRRWLGNCLLALLGVAILATFPAAADVEEGCYLVETIARQIEYLPTFRFLSGERLQRAVEIFNVITRSDTQWTSAYLGIRPDGFGFILVGGDGTVCDGIVIDRDSTEKLLEIIDGVGA